MRSFQSLPITILLGLFLECNPSTAATALAQRCAAIKKSGLSRDWDPTGMAGEYRVQWVSDTGTQPRTSTRHLFLWKTSMLDSSPRTHTHPAPGDTALHPLYGVILPDTGRFTRSRIDQLRAAIDPIYPPVLLLAPLSRDSEVPAREWTILLLGTVGNRRDDVVVLDGAGLGMWVRQADSGGFRGFFKPWGIVVDDRGHFCARRMPN